MNETLITDTVKSITPTVTCASDTLGNNFITWPWENIYTSPYVSEEPLRWADESLTKLGFMAVWSIAVGAILAILAYIVYRNVNFRKSWLKFLFITAFVLGFITYDIGQFTGEPISLLTNAPMAFVHAFGIFLLESDVSAIHGQFHNSWVFMCLFSVTHALGALVSTMFILKYFGFSIRQKMSLYSESRQECPKNTPKNTYVFWDINSHTYNLIESIKQHYDGKGTPYRIIVLKTGDNEDERLDTHTGISKIFNFLSLNKADLETLQNLGCFTASSSVNLQFLSVDPSSEQSTDIISETLHLKLLGKLLTPEKSMGTIRMFFLSDNEEKNLHDISVLLTDSTLKAYVSNPEGTDARNSHLQKKVKFYCHARNNSVHKVIENQYRGEAMEVQIIDSSHINVELLKTNETIQPVNFVDIEADGTISSSFNALVIGFSEVGQDTTRFIYEYGAFVKSGGDANHARRSEFHLSVIDKNMADKAGPFVVNTPAIKPYMPFVSKDINRNSLLELQELDCCSVEFYRQLEQNIPTLNYIVVATENDELNISTAVRILKLAIRKRCDRKKLCILVRIHDDADGRCGQIATYYNKLWASQDATLNEKFRNDQKCELPLYIFGQDEKVYTYSNIIDDSIINNAKEFKELYETSVNPDYKPEEGQSKWDTEENEVLQIGKIYHPTYGDVMSLRRKQNQDISNSQHSLTKKTIFECALDKIGLTGFDWKTINRKPLTTTYYALDNPIDERLQRLLIVLSQTEHLRWNASHEILGYMYDANGKNESLLLHNCLTAWDKLNEKTRSYDCNVVDVTLGIKKPLNKQVNDDRQGDYTRAD